MRHLNLTIPLTDDELEVLYRKFVSSHIAANQTHFVDNIKNGVYRVFPGLDAFKINGAYVPYIDIIADSCYHAIKQCSLIMNDGDDIYSENTTNFAVFLYKH